MEEKNMNKRGQLAVPIITLAIIIIGLILMAPFLLKIFNSVLTPFETVLGNQTTVAGEAVGTISNTFTTWFDWVVFLVMIINILLFLISAFLIDTHPAFVLVFILAGFFMLLFAPTIVQDVMGKVYDTGEFNTEQAQLPVTNFISDYFGVVMVGIMVLGGVILYARIRYGGRVV